MAACLRTIICMFPNTMEIIEKASEENDYLKNSTMLAHVHRNNTKSQNTYEKDFLDRKIVSLTFLVTAHYKKVSHPLA